MATRGSAGRPAPTAFFIPAHAGGSPAGHQHAAAPANDAANSSFSKQKRPVEVARFLRKFDARDRLEVVNALLSIGLHHYQQMTGGEADMRQLMHTTQQIRRLPSLQLANHGGGQRHESRAVMTRQLAPPPQPRSFAFGRDREAGVRSSSAPQQRQGRVGSNRGRSSSAGLRQFLEEERLRMRDGRNTRQRDVGDGAPPPQQRSPFVTVHDKPGGCYGDPPAVVTKQVESLEPSAERSEAEETRAPSQASEGAARARQFVSELHPRDLDLAVAAAAATVGPGALELQGSGTMTNDDGSSAMPSRQPSTPWTSSSQSRSQGTALDAVIASADPEPTAVDGVFAFPLAFIEDLQRVVAAMNGTRASALLVAAQLSREHANLTARRGFPELYRSALINFHISSGIAE